jgi:hypothetical protein
MLALLVFAACDIRDAAAAHFGKTSATPAIEFELRRQNTAELARTPAA